MNKSNVTNFEVARKRNKMKMINITELGGSEIGYYKANVKTHLMTFIYEQISDMRQVDAAKKLDITQAEVSLLKSLRVSQFSIDRLFEMAYRTGFTFNLLPQMNVNLSRSLEQREVE